MPITMLYAGALGVVFLVLSIRVIAGRQSTKTYMGDGGNPKMLRLMRGHGNFAEYVPLVLVLMALLENSGASHAVMHGIGATLLAGRLLHAYTFAFSDHFLPGRFLGINLTFLALLAASGLCLWYGVKAL